MTQFQNLIDQVKKDQLAKYKTILDQSKGQIIFYGPPGTGKTFIAKQLANMITGVDPDAKWTTSTHRKIVQFHPSYSYEDFVQGIKPVSEPPNINYKLQPGTFQEFCKNLYITKTSSTSAPESMQDAIALVLLREEADGGNSLPVNQIHDRLKNGYTAHNYDSLHTFTGKPQYQYGVVNHRCHDFWEHGNPSHPADEENWWFEHTKGTGDWCMNKNCTSYDDLKQKFESLEQVQEDRNSRVLIIDEINRGNLSKIFGELIYGLEYRDEEIDLQYNQFDPGSELGVLSIPKFIKIIGTMNTADRSIILFDAALRRRFSFIPLFPDYDLLAMSLDIDVKFDESEFEKMLKDEEDRDKKLKILSILALHNINLKLSDNESVGREKQIGHTFLLDMQEHPENFTKIWAQDILPLLEEYYFESPETIEEWFTDSIYSKQKGIMDFDDKTLENSLNVLIKQNNSQPDE